MFEERCVFCGVVKETADWPLCTQEARIKKLDVYPLVSRYLTEHIFIRFARKKRFYDYNAEHVDNYFDFLEEHSGE